MASVFWDRKYVLLVDFMEPVATITADHYCTALRKLKKAKNYYKARTTRGQEEWF